MVLWGVATTVLFAVLALASKEDLRNLRLPDGLTLGLVALGLALSGLVSGIALPDRLIGAGIGFLVFWIIGEAHFRLRGTEGLGLGDAKLFAAAGSWLGWAWLPTVLLVAAPSAIVVAFLRPGSRRFIAFGPFLSVGFGLVWLWLTLAWRLAPTIAPPP